MLPAIIPVNRLDRAKGRLNGLLSPDERRALALATLATVIGAANGAGLDAIVLTADDAVAIAVEGHASVLRESATAHGLNGQLKYAIAGRAEALILHADLPFATAESVAAVVEAAPAPPSLTVVRSSDGGTNVMLLRPEGRPFSLAYGAGSFARHVLAANQAELAVEEVTSADLSLDLDTPDDIATFMSREGWAETLAGQLVATWNLGDRFHR